MKKVMAMPGMDADYAAEADLNTLLEADEVREDKSRMAAVRKLAKEKLLDIAKVSALPDEKPEPGDDDKGD